jgi:hypothetical protein
MADGASGMIDGSGVVFDSAATRLEAFARPLWGLAAAAAGGVDDPSWWQTHLARLTDGLDPKHADYWGEGGPYDQRLVELAAVSIALCIAPKQLWDPLDPITRQRLVQYLEQARGLSSYSNNWKFFPILIDLGLRSIGGRGDRRSVEACFSEIDSFYVGDGWYRDGSATQLDHYIGFAFHFYSLLYAGLTSNGSVQSEEFRSRASSFAAQFIHWFADDGAALPFGRSLIYRFACVSFLGACAFAGVEALPWGVMKGLYLRNLRWWRRWPITRRDGILSVGYAYPNQLMAENYNSAASPYWAFKAFLPLALPDDHPFWSAEESDLPARLDAVVVLPKPGMLIAHEPGQTTALVAGQANSSIASGAEKYAKFAYSTRYAFSVESDLRRFDRCTFDSMIGFADNDGSWRVRERCEHAAIHGDILFARWRPWHDVTVETWLYWDRPWHIRVHRIRSARALRSIEGGFCVGRADGSGPFGVAETGAARCETPDDFSGILDLLAPAGRLGRVHLAEPNRNLLHPRTVVPQLTGAIVAGETILACAVIASPDLAGCNRAWAAPPNSIRPLPQS